MYTIKDISQMTRLTTRTIQNHLKEGLLKGHKIGRSWRFTEADFKNYLNNPSISNQLNDSTLETIQAFIKAKDTEGACTQIKVKMINQDTVASYHQALETFMKANLIEDLKLYTASYDESSQILTLSIIASLETSNKFTQFIEDFLGALI